VLNLTGNLNFDFLVSVNFSLLMSFRLLMYHKIFCKA
jgi:hypothetical protein